MITRFAPSPTGPLHLGHAYSAWRAYDLAQSMGGEFLLRIEDIDQSRARAQWETQIYDDLTWLGLSWPEPVMRQSDRSEAYEQSLDRLWDMGLLYACGCNRRDIAAALSAPQEGAELGPDGVIYPGTCRHKPRLQTRPQRNDGLSLRLDMARVAENFGRCFYEELEPKTTEFTVDPVEMITTVGDIIVARRGMGTSYHLSVVVDDAAQGITHVVRGVDLASATQIHVVLQRLLGLSTPQYLHHRLVRDDAGKRLAKRDDAKAVSLFRDQGSSPDSLRRDLGLG